MKVRDLALPAIALIVLAADQASKAWVIESVPLNGSLEVIPSLKQWFVVTHITNSGAAFGLFPQLGLVFTFVALGVSVVIVAYHRSIPAGQWLVRMSLGLQLGGAIGNLIDRLRFGYVVDMLYVRFWPVFNIADSAIVCGVALLMWHLMRTPPKKTEAISLPSTEPENTEMPGN
jgi:signal peptidase II